MLVVSMNDFLSNPKQYMEQAQHTSVLVENAGESVRLTRGKPNFFSAFKNLFGIKRHRDERDRRDMEIINTHAERFNEDAKENLEFQADIWGDK